MVVENERWFSMDEIAEYLGVSRDSILNWINDKNFPAHKIGRLWRFKPKEVDDWVKQDGIK